MRLLTFAVLVAGCAGDDPTTPTKTDDTGTPATSCGGDPADSDGDGVCDPLDLCTGDDATGDTDADGLCDDADACPLDPAGADDDDGDGVCNADDLCTGDDASGDADADGVCGDLDICPDDPLDDCFNDCVIDFEDAWHVLGLAADPTSFYPGVTLDNAAGYGISGGMTYGDPGNWDIEGSAGPAFWGLWSGDHGIAFDEPATDVSMDFLRAFGDLAFTVEARLGGQVVETANLAVTGAFARGTVQFAGPLDEVVWTFSDAYGLDNLRYTTLDACPAVWDACAVGFDSVWETLGQGTDPTDGYTAYGIQFDNTAGYGVISGMGNGDVGNWDIEGTNGSAVWGQWPGDHEIDFGVDVIGLSMDFLRGFSDESFIVTAYHGVDVVDTDVVDLSGAFNADRVSFVGVIDRVAWTSSGYFGVDNVRYRTQDTCPLEVAGCVLNMDDAWAVSGQGGSPNDLYGVYGLNFDDVGVGYGLIGGVGNGDPGNWDIEGTNGSAAWGLWPGTHGITFNGPVEGLSFDVLRGFSDGDVTVDAFFEGSLVGRVTVTLSGAFDAEEVAFAGPVDRVSWTSSLYFGVDDVQFEGACPVQ
ncbi:MAG: hypothetical protein R3F59_23075 [Myxococcota bacterium]